MSKSKSKTTVISDDKERNIFITGLLGFDIVRPLEITWGNYVQKRSGNQNSLVHKWFDEIAKATGDDGESVKTHLKDRYCPKTESLAFPGEMVPKKTSALDKEEMSDFMSRIMVLSSQMGWHLTSPEDRGRAI